MLSIIYFSVSISFSLALKYFEFKLTLVEISCSPLYLYICIGIIVYMEVYLFVGSHMIILCADLKLQEYLHQHILTATTANCKFYLAVVAISFRKSRTNCNSLLDHLVSVSFVGGLVSSLILLYFLRSVCPKICFVQNTRYVCICMGEMVLIPFRNSSSFCQRTLFIIIQTFSHNFSIGSVDDNTIFSFWREIERESERELFSDLYVFSCLQNH